MRSTGSRSQTVRYNNFKSSGIPGHACKEPVERDNILGHDIIQAIQRTTASLQIRSNTTRPEASDSQIAHKMRTNERIIPGASPHHEGIASYRLSAQQAARKEGQEVPRIWFETFEIPKQFGRGRSRHESRNDRVPETKPSNPRSQRNEIVSSGRRNAPHIHLEQAPSRRRPCPFRIRSVYLGQTAAGIQRRIVYGLEYGYIELASADGGERQPEPHKDVR